LAIERNKLFARATAAYKSGRMAEAKAYGAEGRRVDARMREASRAAATRIFKQRNTDESLSKGVIDLHGLHKDEAQEMLEELLPQLRDKRLQNAVILTGSGHHTLGPQKGKARLRAAVETILQDWGMRYSSVADGGGHVGAFSVSLASVNW